MPQYIKTFNSLPSSTQVWGLVSQVTNLVQSDGSTVLTGMRHVPVDTATAAILDGQLPLIPANAVAQQGVANGTITNGVFTGTTSIRYTENGLTYNLSAQPTASINPLPNQRPALVPPSNAPKANAAVPSVHVQAVQGMPGT